MEKKEMNLSYSSENPLEQGYQIVRQFLDTMMEEEVVKGLDAEGREHFYTGVAMGVVSQSLQELGTDSAGRIAAQMLELLTNAVQHSADGEGQARQ